MDDDDVIGWLFIHSHFCEVKQISSHRISWVKCTLAVHGYAAWDGSPMQTNTIPRYPGLVAPTAQASSRQADEHDCRSGIEGISEAVAVTSGTRRTASLPQGGRRRKRQSMELRDSN